MMRIYSLLLALVLAIVWTLSSAENNKEASFTLRLRDNGEGGHSRYKRGWNDFWGKNRRKKKRDKGGKQNNEMDLLINFPDGESKDIVLSKRKKVVPKVPEYAIKNGRLVQKTKSTIGSSPEISLFQDLTNGSGSALLMSCDEIECKVMGAFYNGTEVSAFEATDTNPFSNKAKSVKGVGDLELEDERTPGFKKDGTPFGFDKRRKRDLVLTRKMKEALKAKRRKKRALGPYVVELLILADYTEYEYWVDRSGGDQEDAEQALQLYYILLANMMDQRFASLNTEGIDITFMITGIIYSETAIDSPWITDTGDKTMDIDDALDELTVWLMQNKAYLPPHDHVLSVSKMDFTTVKDGVTSASPIGAAWTGGMCDPNFSVSIIEDPGLGLIDFAATHELGHSIWLGHDAGSGSGCEGDKFYVMAPSGGSPQGADSLSNTNKATNPFQFSSCSKTSIKERINSLIASEGDSMCLLVNTFNQSEYDSYKAFSAPGTFLPIDTQCELMLGYGSKRCYELDENLCSDGAWCWNPSQPLTCHILYVREGTLCGEQKRCHDGICVDSDIVMPTCPPTNVLTNDPLDEVIAIGAAAGDSELVLGEGSMSTTVAPYSGTAQATLDSFTYSDKSGDVIC